MGPLQRVACFCVGGGGGHPTLSAGNLICMGSSNSAVQSTNVQLNQHHIGFLLENIDIVLQKDTCLVQGLIIPFWLAATVWLNVNGVKSIELPKEAAHILWHSPHLSH